MALKQIKVDPTETRSSYRVMFYKDRLSESNGFMIKKLEKQVITKSKYQRSASSFIGYFKIDNRSIKTLFQGEIKYLNLTNHNFLRALDLFRFIKHAIVKLVASLLNFFTYQLGI